MDSVKEDGNGRQNGWPVFLQTVCLSVIHSDSHTAWHPLSTMSSAELHPTWSASSQSNISQNSLRRQVTSRDVLWHEKLIPRISLVVQGLRLCAPKTGGLGSIPRQGTRSHMLRLKVPVPQLKQPACRN